MLALGITTLVWNAAGATSAAPEKPFHCGARFQRPAFADLDDFVQAVQAQEEPWDVLMQPNKNPYSENEAGPEVEAPGAWTKEIVHDSRRQAIVFIQHKENRYAPFSALVFLLSRKGGRWHVTDFVRRSNDGRDSGVRTPKMLKLCPAGLLHFYFTEDVGGRKWGIASDEFYTVDGTHLRRTLLLKTDGAYMSPADPWREFDQRATVEVVAGRLRVSVQRTWGLESGEDRKQSFAVTFHWDSRRKKFASHRANTLSLNEPIAWTAQGLPSPPAE